MSQRPGLVRTLAGSSLLLLLAAIALLVTGTTPSVGGAKRGARGGAARTTTARTEVRPEAPAPDPAPARRDRTRKAHLPIAGKGMWIYEMDRIRRGDPARIAAAAARRDFSHIFVRVGSGWGGLRTLDEAARILPAAHRRGIKVIAWYFPYFINVNGEVNQSVRAIRTRHRGHRFDGFAADIERVPGSRFRVGRIQRYNRGLQRRAGDMPLISVVPWPSRYQVGSFPYAASVRGYDAIAPMAYWGFYSPGHVVRESMRVLGRFGLPIAPIGQAYNMGPEGGPRGRPHPAALRAFLDGAKRGGAVGVSFWSWQHAGGRLLRAVERYRWRD